MCQPSFIDNALTAFEINPTGFRPIAFSNAETRLDKVELGTPIAAAAPRKLMAFATSTKSAMSLSSMFIAPIMQQ
jgi:hypothetical protein